MLAKLVVVGGKANRDEIRLKLPTTVGRSRKSGIVIDHHTVSRQHCELYEENGKLHVRDLGSLNGTFVAGDQVQGGCLEHGAELTIGPLTFQVVYNALEAPAPEVDDAVITDSPATVPELAQTVVDLPRVSQRESIDELVEPSAAPLMDLAADEPIEPSLPAKDAPAATASPEAEASPAIELTADDDFELAAEVSAVDLAANAPQADAPEQVASDSSDELGFELSEPDDVIAPAAPAAAAPVAEDDFLAMMAEETARAEPEPTPPLSPETLTEAAAPEEPGTALSDDDFLDMVAEETQSAAAPVATPSPATELTFDEPSPEPTAASAGEIIEEELDWLAGDDAAATTPAEVDLNELSANMPPNPSAAAETVMEEVEVLAFDEPAQESPVVTPAEPPAAEPKKKRGLWPFGRKKKQPDEAPAAAVQPSAGESEPPVATPEPETMGAETIVMETIELEEVTDAGNPIVDITLTQQLAHEQTVILDDPVELTAEEAPAEPAVKPKRGLFGRGRKQAAAPETTESQAAAEPAATAEPVAADEPPTKKRGWWPFSKKEAKPSAPAVAAAEPAATIAPSVAPADAPAASPSPESFEFSDEELLEITAETAPAEPPRQPNPQELAADEVLDFELDLPLHDSSGNIAPILSDAPPPTTGADDDDFLDFLAEELPAAKQKGKS